MSCHRCDSERNERKFISYKKNTSMSPLCIECYNEISPEQVLDYCKYMIQRWKFEYLGKRMADQYIELVKEEPEMIDNCWRFIRLDKLGVNYPAINGGASLDTV